MLLRQGIEASRIEPIGDGRVSWTFDIDDEWIVQLPRFDAVVQKMRTQARLMPEIQAVVPFAVPVPELIAEWGGVADSSRAVLGPDRTGAVASA